MITYVTGNLLDTSIKFIAHGCNARGVMGKGVARTIREKYPKAYDDYCANLKAFKPLPGDIIRSLQPDGKVILNLITQKDFAKYVTNTHRFISYDAVAIAFSRLENNHQDVKLEGIAIPRIGSGLGGGNWGIIENLILSCAPNIPITVYDLPTPDALPETYTAEQKKLIEVYDQCM